MLSGFIEKGSDEALLKSLKGIEGVNQEELLKAIDKSKLVQVEVTVQGKGGTFTRKQWKRAGDVKSGDKVVGQPQQNSQDLSGYFRGKGLLGISDVEDAQKEIKKLQSKIEDVDVSLRLTQAGTEKWSNGQAEKKEYRDEIDKINDAIKLIPHKLNQTQSRLTSNKDDDNSNGSKSIGVSDFSKKSYDEIVNILEKAPEGTIITGIIEPNSQKRFGHDNDVLIKKCSGYVANYAVGDKKHETWWEVNGSKQGDIAGTIMDAIKGKSKYYKLRENQDSGSVIGKDFTKLTTEKEAETSQGEVHNMLVGYLKSNGQKPTTENVKKGLLAFLKENLKKQKSSVKNTQENGKRLVPVIEGMLDEIYASEKKQPKQAAGDDTKSTYFKAEQSTKTKVAQMSSEMGNDKLLQFAKDNGVTWSEHDHKGINIMRMKMALSQAIQEGKINTSSEELRQPLSTDKATKAPQQTSKIDKASLKYPSKVTGTDGTEFEFDIRDGNPSDTWVVEGKNRVGQNSNGKRTINMVIRPATQREIRGDIDANMFMDKNSALADAYSYSGYNPNKPKSSPIIKDVTQFANDSGLKLKSQPHKNGVQFELTSKGKKSPYVLFDVDDTNGKFVVSSALSPRHKNISYKQFDTKDDAIAELKRLSKQVL